LLHTMLLFGAMVICRIPLSAAAWVNRLFVPVYVKYGSPEVPVTIGLLAKTGTTRAARAPYGPSNVQRWPTSTTKVHLWDPIWQRPFSLSILRGECQLGYCPTSWRMRERMRNMQSLWTFCIMDSATSAVSWLGRFPLYLKELHLPRL